ncbi:hypothetical protein [Fluviicola taffensis]|uniref:Lipoprotein n=1 Tax=Fluviicola taffensis (strain DSM 16823 / NCIMB 13979 / RW262) TaxID=755732 RepID=F2IAN3_FLUTR|nr:hypothetical protein [Fluviicola taffensis]AEA44188.1 hypothetical protein Fluta_2202 [Fluviicola taffensis DSM 16823]
MKNSKKSIFTILLGMGLLVVSCKKETPEPVVETPTPVNTPAGSTTPTPTDADGVMWAIKSSSTIQGITIEIGTAVGIFMNGNTDLVNVGTVSVNSQDLTAATNNAYTFTPSQTSPMGLDFSSSTDWSVTGGSGHAAFTYDASSLVFPTGSAVTSSATVNKANGYTLSCATVSGADSTLFMVGNVSKTVSGSANSCTFSPAELNGLSSGTSIVSIVPYKLMQTTINGKTYYFGKERVNQLTVTIE